MPAPGRKVQPTSLNLGGDSALGGLTRTQLPSNGMLQYNLCGRSQGGLRRMTLDNSMEFESVSHGCNHA